VVILSPNENTIDKRFRRPLREGPALRVQHSWLFNMFRSLEGFPADALSGKVWDEVAATLDGVA
jgi:hypothetical protein